MATYLADRKWGRVKYEMEHEDKQTLVLVVRGRADGSGGLVRGLPEGFEYGPIEPVADPGKDLVPARRTIDVAAAIVNEDEERDADPVPVPSDPTKTH